MLILLIAKINFSLNNIIFHTVNLYDGMTMGVGSRYSFEKLTIEKAAGLRGIVL
jgi:hypothetical protein